MSRLGRLLRHGWLWALDYAYVGFWQVQGFLFRVDPSAYLEVEGPTGPSAAPSDRSPVLGKRSAARRAARTSSGPRRSIRLVKPSARDSRMARER